MKLQETVAPYKMTRSEWRTVKEAKRILREKLLKSDKPLESPALAADYFMMHHAKKEREQFDILYLDTRHRPIAVETLFHGTLNGATIHPREVLKAALRYNAHAVILSHNHPSGVAEPSQSDMTLTRRIREVLELVDIKLLDHLVTGAGESVSMSDRGMF